jgi:hypothetical protein
MVHESSPSNGAAKRDSASLKRRLSADEPFYPPNERFLRLYRIYTPALSLHFSPKSKPHV